MNQFNDLSTGGDLGKFSHDPAIEHVMVAFGLASPGGKVLSRPLDGGVSSDISVVTTDRGTYCLKRALAKLKVEADWHAPVERSTYEARWLRTADDLAPGGAPRLLGHDPDSGYVVMEYLPNDQYHLWKSELLAGRVDPAFAERVGDLLGRIHSGASRRANDIRPDFESTELFMALRIEPYLHATARRHPDLQVAFAGLAESLVQHRISLVHGDVSPKNLLRGPDDAPKLLDAECAWWGDPAFDLAFCCNHLLLKQLVVADQVDTLHEAAHALVSAYTQHVDWEPVEDLQTRTARLLPALALARVDGKSPVEYFDEQTRRICRRRARELLTRDLGLLDLLDYWKAEGHD